MKPAFFVIDMQKAYYDNEAKKSMDKACEYINVALSYFRDKRLPVIWVQDKDKEEGVVPGTSGFEIIELLKPLKEEKNICKEYANAFNKTDCDEYLRMNGIDTIILSGFCAENCVLSTYRGSKDLDYTPIMLRNALASRSLENIDFVEKISDLITYNALRKMVENF